MKRNTAVQVELVESEQVEQVEADGLETIGELAREGFGPVDVLMREFAGLVCVPGVAARDLLAARAGRGGAARTAAAPGGGACQASAPAGAWRAGAPRNVRVRVDDRRLR